MFFARSATLIFTLGLFLFSPFLAKAENVDLAIYASSISFSTDTLIAGHDVRIYATIKNLGDVDTSAQVFFYQGTDLIGKSQIVSVLVGGEDDVYVDHTLPLGSFNIHAVVQGANPADMNPSNDEAVTPLYRTYADTDDDGVIDNDDNCDDEANSNQDDTDNDGQGDVCDSDRDGDGVANSQDAYPDDPNRSSLPKVEPPPAPSPAPTPSKPVVTGTVQGEEDEAPEEVVVEEEKSQPNVLGVTQTVESKEGVSFTFTQTGWKTYEFNVSPTIGDFAYTYAWDFGDGTTSVQEDIKHTFPATGAYTVTLGRVSETGAVASASHTLVVSFFNLGNPILVGTLGVLAVILLGLVWLIFRLRRGREV